MTPDFRAHARRFTACALMTLADSRYAVTGDSLLAVGGRNQLADGAARRVRQAEGGAARAWWQEVAGVLNAPAAE